MKPVLPALALALALAPRAAHAGDLRPYDAPQYDAERSHVPPLPVGYITQEENGIRFSYHPSAGERVRLLLRRAEAIRAELSAEMGRRVLDAVEVRIASVPGEMGQIAPTEMVPGYAPVLAFSKTHLVVMSASSPISYEPPDLEVWLRHGLAHLALDEAAGSKAILPRWFHEGYAVEFAGQDTAVRGHSLCLATLRHHLIPLGSIESQFPADAPQISIAYAEAADFARFLTSGSNRARFAGFIERVRGGEPFEAALKSAYDTDLSRIERVWRKDMARRYSFVPVFVIALLVWLFIAAALVVRRMRRRRAQLAAQQNAREEVARRAIVSTARLGPRTPRPRIDLGEDDIGEPIPPDPEVPKVEHDGRWHTLH